MRISHPRFDQGKVEERYADACEDLPFLLDGVKSNPKNLSLLISTASDVACCGVALDTEHTMVRRALRIAGQASWALFVTASSEELPVEVRLDDGLHCVFNERPDQSTTHAFRWLRGFFFNAICRESGLIDDMCKLPTELLRRSSTKDPEYRYLLVDALKAFWNGDSQCSTIIVNALEATDPERSDIHEQDWALDIDVPQLQLFFYVATKDRKFEANLPKAADLHNQYWSANKKRRNNWDGFLSVELTGLAAIAHDRGMPVQIDASSIPSWLVNDSE